MRNFFIKHQRYKKYLELQTAGTEKLTNNTDMKPKTTIELTSTNLSSSTTLNPTTTIKFTSTINKLIN